MPDLCALRAQFTIQIRAHPKAERFNLSRSLNSHLSFTCHPPPTLSLRGGGLLRLKLKYIDQNPKTTYMKCIELFGEDAYTVLDVMIENEEIIRRKDNWRVKINWD